MFGLQNLSGNTLGQYELRELLGSGGMGAVYLGYQAALERLVAIKVLNMSLITDADYLARFTREAKTSASLEHPHIVPVHDYGTHQGISFVVMRYLTGGSLAERLDHSVKTGRPLPSLSETALIIRQLAGALDYAHVRGVIHRDVKTNNVMFDNQGTAFLVDFGIAKLTHSTSALTGTGMSVGTPSYMAPEQWRGEDITPAADQYALAVTAYAMLTGRLPFEAETPFVLMHKHLNEIPTPIHTFRSDLPLSVKDVLSKALAKDPADRYESTSAFAADLEEAVHGKGGAPTGFFLTPLPPKPKREMPDHPTVTPSPAPVAPAAAGPGKTIAEIPPVLLPLLDDRRDDTGIEKTTAGSVSGAEVTGGSASVIPPPRRPVSGGLMILVALVIVAGVVGAVLLSTRNNPPPVDGERNGTSAVTRTDGAELLTPSGATQVAIIGDGTEEASETPAVTTSRTATRTASPTVSPSPTAPPPTVTPSQTRTPTATPTPTITLTLDVRGAALATRDAFGTATEMFRDITPTPDLQQTLAAELTALHAEDLTATAAQWTPTATPTATRTRTVTPTSTRTPRPTATATVTLSPVPATNELVPVVSSTPQPVAVCQGTRPSRLTVGSEGYVLQDDRRALNVRRGAGTSFSVVAQLQIGETFNVLEGPFCGQSFAWFRIEARSGSVIGWLAEGDEDSYFVAPSTLADPLTTFNLKPECEIILQDDFEAGATPNNWFTSSTDRYVVDVFNGAYNLQINFLRSGGVGDPQGEGAPILWGSLAEPIVTTGSVEAVITASLFTNNDDVRTGLWLHYQDERNFIAFMLRGDGAYRIARYQAGVFTTLVDWTYNAAIGVGDGATNTLRVEIEENTYRLYINGQFMASAEDETWQEGRVAFWGASPRTPVTFALDYFRICAN